MCLFLGVLGLFYALLDLPPYHWYHAPWYFFGAMYAAIGAASLVERARRPALRTIVLTASVAIVASLAYSTWERPLGRSIRELDYRRIAGWLREHTEADASVAMIEVGIIGYHSERRIVDILGVVSPHNARALGEHRFGDWLPLYRPDYILLHAPLVPHERAAMTGPEVQRYVRDTRFPIPGFALLRRN